MAVCLHGAELGCTSLLLATLAGHAFAALLNQVVELVTAQLHASGVPILDTNCSASLPALPLLRVY